MVKVTDEKKKNKKRRKQILLIVIPIIVCCLSIILISLVIPNHKHKSVNKPTTISEKINSKTNKDNNSEKEKSNNNASNKEESKSTDNKIDSKNKTTNNKKSTNNNSNNGNKNNNNYNSSSSTNSSSNNTNNYGTNNNQSNNNPVKPQPTYSCPSGYSLNGTQCTSIIDANYNCPSNMAEYAGGACINFSEGYDTDSDTCPSGYGVLKIINWGAPDTYKCYLLHQKIYTCSGDYSLYNGSKCIKTISATMN